MNFHFRCFRRTASTLVLVILCLAFPVSAKSPNELELAALPEYCQVKLQFTGSEKWESLLGRKTWLHLHHYCYGVLEFNRASMQMDSFKRSHHVNRALQNMLYVLRNWPSDSQLYPQAQMYKVYLEGM